MVKVDLADAEAAGRVPGDVDGVRVVTEVVGADPAADGPCRARCELRAAGQGSYPVACDVRIGIQASYSGGFQETAAEIRDLEAAGLDIAMVAEVYTFDAVSQLGYLAAVTERVELMSAIFPIYSRTPALTAMTAAGLDFVSGGRFTLGLGASGPQVIEGWHGVPYDAPLQRTREIVEICRQGVAPRAARARRAEVHRSRCRPTRAPGWASR